MWGLLFVVAFAVRAALLPTDGTFDLANYHFYDGFAIFHDRKALDIFPAQQQTAFFYGPDIVYYSIFSLLNDQPVLINLLLSIPYSLAALAIFYTARIFAAPGFRWPLAVSLRGDGAGLQRRRDLGDPCDDTIGCASGSRVSDCARAMAHLERARRNTVWTALGLAASPAFRSASSSLRRRSSLACLWRSPSDWRSARDRRSWRRSRSASGASSFSPPSTEPGCGAISGPTGTRSSRS